MAIIARLVGEGIGPFKSFDFDFSDARGNPHPGPHILAGINGSGKSTILRTLAWIFEWPGSSYGFPWQEWQHLTKGHDASRAMAIVALPGDEPFAWAQTLDTSHGWTERLHEWMKAKLATGKVESLKGQRPPAFSGVFPRLDPSQLMASGQGDLVARRPTAYLRIGGREKIGWRQRILASAYGPSRSLKHLSTVDLSVRLQGSKQNSLSFETTVQNDAVQSWLLGLFSKRAIAKEHGKDEPKYSATLRHFERALKLVCDQPVELRVELEPLLHPVLLMFGRKLDFAQIPDGVRSTVGWLADFLMRMDIHEWSSHSDPSQETALLLDEVDAHLHPKWQRSILPSIKEALPKTQVFVTSHSPFVVSSCRGARIHVLDFKADGAAYNRPPEEAPIGESIQATMKDIFGVNSRFDIETERLLEEWNELHKSQITGNISAKGKQRMAELTRNLASRSEELRQIVSPVVSINDSLVSTLKSQAQGTEQLRKRKVERKRG